MANRYGAIVGTKKISEDFQTINTAFDRVQTEMDTKGTPADAQAKADAAKAAAIAAAAADLAAHKARGADEHPNATGAAAGFMSSADKGRMNAATADPTASALMQRDAAGRAKVAAPAASDDIARKAEIDTVQGNLDSHAADADIHVTAADHDKLNGIDAGAEVNQNAFAQVNDVVADDPSDTVTFEGSTGITVTTDPEGKRIVFTATGEATPGAHASSHITGGTDVIPNAVIGGSSGLMSGADALFVRQDGESKAGAQAKADAALAAANAYTDGKVAEIVIDDASLTQKGIVQLSSSTGSNSETEAATPKALNTVRQQADAKIGDLTQLQTTDKDSLVDALNEVFTHVDEGKELVKTAVIVKGGTVAGTSPHSFEELADGIDTIKTSTVINGQTTKTVIYGESIAANDPIYTMNTLVDDTTVDTSPGGATYAVTWTPDGLYLACAVAFSPYVAIYKRNGKTFTRLPSPAILPAGQPNSAAFSPDGVYLAITHGAAPFVTVYKRSGDTFTKLPNFSSLPSTTGNGVGWSPDGTYLMIGQTSDTYLCLYKRSGDTFTRLSNPAVLPTGQVYNISFTSDGLYMAVAHLNAPYLTVYKRSGDVFTKLADPAVLPIDSATSAVWSPDDTYLAVSHAGARNLTMYKRNGDNLTKLPDLEGILSGTGYGGSFSPITGNYSYGSSSAPYIATFERNGDVFTRLRTPMTVPSSLARSCAYSADGEFLAVSSTSGTNQLIVYRPDNKTYRSNNLLSDLQEADGAGYALENGVAGDLKNAVLIWRYKL